MLLLHPGALGDIVLALPAVSLLREHLHPSELTLAGNLDYVEAVAEGFAERVRSLSAFPIPRLFGPGPLPVSDLSLWRAYDRIVSWTGGRDPSFKANLAGAHDGAIIADWKPAAGDTRHVSQIFADSLVPWIGDVPMVRPVCLRPAAAASHGGLEWLHGKGWDGSGTIVALHPGAGGEAKRWPLDNFAVVADFLSQETATRILIVEGPAEKGLGEKLRNASGRERVLLARSLPLPTLMGVLSRCRAFLGNDSGIAHLAAGLGLPCVVLFGPTAPGHWAPLGRRVRVLRSNSSCRACLCGSSSGHTCMQTIGVKAVMGAISEAAHVS